MNMKEALFNKNFFCSVLTTPSMKNLVIKTCIFQALMSEHEKRGNNFLSSILILFNAVVVYHAI